MWIPTRTVATATGCRRRLLLLPADLRHHHACADHRCDRGTHEVLSPMSLHRRLDVRCLLRWPTTCGVLTGYMNGVWNAAAPIKAMDFAGGTVVHMSSGYSGLVLALIIGKRIGWGKHSLRASQHGAHLHRCVAALGRLYGFNAGSRLCGRRPSPPTRSPPRRSPRRSARLSGPRLSTSSRAEATVVGFCSGAVAGLVVITPALRLRHPHGRLYHRCDRGNDSLHHHDLPQASPRL